LVLKARAQAVLVAMLGLGALLAGCGGTDDGAGSATSATHAPAKTQTRTAGAPVATPVVAARNGPIPHALRTAESDAEDTIDLALAGRRARVVAKADELRAVAKGAAASALSKAGVSAAEIAEFRTRAAEVARLAPRADLVDVALASNRAFALMPDFFAHFDSPIPPAVTALDHLDFEAKLQARAGHVAAIAPAVAQLDRTWTALRPDVVGLAGGRHVAARFDAHVARMHRLAARGGPGAAREAQRGLDLVDEIEAVYEH
jgi:hypothetical protein